MYPAVPGLVLGFHGCDLSLRDEVINNNKTLKASNNDYDWLGKGIYFWKNNAERALSYAEAATRDPRRNQKVKKPAVLGAVIDLGNCLNLLEEQNLQLVKAGYENMKKAFEVLNKELPKNKPFKSDDLIIRKLDCAVIEMMHESYEQESRPFDSVRGLFTEGRPLYPNAGFHEKSHIQICIRNPNCIKGYFIPRKLDSRYPLP